MIKSAIYKESGKPLVIENVPDPVPTEGEVVIKVGRCGICATDLHMTSGGAFDFPPGTAMGHEYAGEVVETGPGIEHLKVGDRITALPVVGCGTCPACKEGLPFRCQTPKQMTGGFGEYTLAAERTSVKLPSSLSLADGALVEPVACGRRAVDFAGLTPNMRVAVLGAGAMGMAAIYWARLAGANNITVIATSERRKDLALSMGAKDFVTSGDNLAETVTESLDGPADIVFECAGVPGTIAQAIDISGVGSSIIVMGACPHMAQFIPLMGLYKEVRIQFSMAYSVDDFRETVKAFDSGSVEPRHMIQDTICLNDVPDTLESMRKPHPHCKVMVDPWA